MAFVIGPSKNPVIQAAFAGLSAQTAAEVKAAKKVKPEPTPAPKKAAAKKKGTRK